MPQTKQNPIIAAVAAVAFNFASISSANANPEITIFNPYYKGGGQDITLDCAPLKKKLSCDFVEALDGQKNFCDDNKISSSLEKQKETNPNIDLDRAHSNAVMLSAIDHNSRAHFTCTSRYIRTNIPNLLNNYLDKQIQTGEPITKRDTLNNITRVIKNNIANTQESYGKSPSLGNYTLEDFTKKTIDKLENSFKENGEISINELKNIRKGYLRVLKDDVWNTDENKECIVTEAVQQCLAHPEY